VEGTNVKLCLTLLLALLTNVVGLAQDKAVPTTVGLYYATPSGPSRLELATNSGYKTTGTAKAAFSYGIAKAKGKWLYRNPAASAQLSDHRPVFTLVSQIDVSTQAIALLRFDVTKDHREAQYFEYGMWTGIKAEDKNVLPTTVTRIPNSNNLTIVPQNDLPAGEYLLITDSGKGTEGYDFGVK
jgi:hypothetical protein